MKNCLSGTFEPQAQQSSHELSGTAEAAAVASAAGAVKRGRH